MSAGGTLFWAGVIALGVALITPALDRVDTTRPTGVPVETPASQPATQAGSLAEASISNGYASQELLREADGHFYAEAQVNGARVRFMIDTGATFVALTRSDAQRAGIPLGSTRATALGAGGPVEVIPVTIDRIAVGSLAARQVEGAVADDLGVSLLGQSFLSQVGTVEIHGDRIVLR